MDTIAELKKKRLQIEIRKFELETKLYDKELKETNGNKKQDWSELINRGYKIALALIALCTGLWGMIIPVRNFVQNAQKEYEFQLDGVILQSMSMLTSDDLTSRKRAVLTLTYYKKDAIPILLFGLEEEGRMRNKNTQFIELIKGAIVDISNTSERKERTIIHDKILDSFNKLLDSESEKEDTELVNIHGLISYIEVISELQLKDVEKSAVDSRLSNIKKKEWSTSLGANIKERIDTLRTSLKVKE